jgi:hypothetical protein
MSKRKVGIGHNIQQGWAKATWEIGDIEDRGVH